jgi:PAS domain S-box-containing protein
MKSSNPFSLTKKRSPKLAISYQLKDEFSALHTFVQKINTCITSEDVISTTLKEIIRVISPDISFFYLKDKGKLILKNIFPEGEGLILPETKEIGVCLCGLAGKGKPIYSKDIHTDPLCTLNECKKAGIRSFAALPLVEQKTVLGVLSLASYTERDFSQQKAFLEILCSHVANALKNAFLYDSLKASEEKFRMLFVNAPLAYQSLDKLGNIIDVNQVWLDSLGYSREEVIDHPFTAFTVPVFREDFQTCFLNCKQEGVIENLEFEMVHKNGHKIVVSFNGKVQYDSNGKFQRAHCIFQDITESKKKEKALRESDKRFKDIFDKAIDGSS